MALTHSLSCYSFITQCIQPSPSLLLSVTLFTAAPLWLQPKTSSVFSGSVIKLPTVWVSYHRKKSSIHISFIICTSDMHHRNTPTKTVPMATIVLMLPLCVYSKRGENRAMHFLVQHNVILFCFVWCCSVSPSSYWRYSIHLLLFFPLSSLCLLNEQNVQNGPCGTYVCYKLALFATKEGTPVR